MKGRTVRSPRSRLLGWAFDLLTAIRSRHKQELPIIAQLIQEDMKRTRPPQGLRLTERLRDKLRPGWLRLKK